MRIETALQVFIDEVLDEYYYEYACSPEEIIELTDADIVLLPITPGEIKQDYIKVYSS